ncbi:MAG: hypothetical protein ACOC1F_07085 [Myxococcota bacterium]
MHTPDVSGGDDPTEPGNPCGVLAPGGDTYWETVREATASLKICYNVRVVRNDNMPPKDEIQIFHAVLQVRAHGTNGGSGGSGSAIELDFGPPRDVLFLIPAKPQ